MNIYKPPITVISLVIPIEKETWKNKKSKLNSWRIIMRVKKANDKKKKKSKKDIWRNTEREKKMKNVIGVGDERS